MSLKRSFLFLVVNFLICIISYGQTSQFMPNLPPSIKWQQIKSEHFKIIYPKGLEQEAQRTTNILENIYEPATTSLGALPRRFPIILQNQYAVSNGFVTVAPYRSEFYMFEPQDYRFQGNDRWLEKLAVHEYRHMVQFEKVITPFNKIMYFLMGEYGPFLAASLAAPQWLFEGDAVGVETAFGRSGRGRTPYFMMAFKANLIEKGGFNYYKQHLKSFRDLVPNHYVTGYLMTTYLKNKSGVDVWDRILDRSFHRPYIPFTFTGSIKKESGSYLVPTYKEMMAEQKQLYTEQLNQISPTPFTTLKHEPNPNFTNYYYPRKVLDNQTLAVKSGFSVIPTFVLIDQQGNEEPIFALGPWQNPAALSSNDSLVVWTELELDPRWQRRTYSVIKKLDLRTKKAVQLTKKTKYQAPAISNNGQWIAAIHQSESGLLEIHLLDAKTGEMIKAFRNPENNRYAVPQFDAEDKKLVLLKNLDEGKTMVIKDIETEKEESLFFSDQENLGNPILMGSWIFYATDHNGIDNIYAINIEDGERYQVTSSKFGAFSPRPSKNGELLYNEYTADGFEMAAVSIKPDSWKKVDEVKYVGLNFHQKMVDAENHEEVLYNYPDSTYETSKYPKLLKTVRPHSWGLSTAPVNNNFGWGIYSNDLLQTTSLGASALYNSNENVWRFIASASYQALFPVIDARVSLGARTTDVLVQEGGNIYTRTYHWDENSVSLGFRIPLLLTNSKYSRQLSFGASTQYTSVENYDIPFSSPVLTHVRNGELISTRYSASYVRLLKKNYLDLNSKWGQTLQLIYKQTPFGGDYQSEQFSAQLGLYFPGVFRHHSLHLTSSYQYDHNDEYQFSSPIQFTRGYNYTSFDHYTNLAINYKMPLAYLDWHVGPIFNLRRIYVNAFYDYGIGRNNNGQDADISSVGAELSFNFNLFRLLPLLDVGMRYSHLPETNDQVFEVIFGAISL